MGGDVAQQGDYLAHQVTQENQIILAALVK